MELVKSNADLQKQMIELIAVNKRPIHCTDTKREKWKKKGPEHPDHKNGDLSINNEYMKLVRAATNGSKENLIKVIKRISKEVLIKKEHHRH